MQTPAKKPLVVPTKALADAIAMEWQTNGKYNPSKMPLTSVAYTAIDRIAGQKETIVEVLLVYVDTDTLGYRASGSEALAKQQKEQWDPILSWVNEKLGIAWQVTSGVMPIDQMPEVHNTLGKYLSKLTEFELSAASMLASSLSSLVLMLAVVEGHIDAAEAFRLSRLEEEFQAQQWGHDMEAQTRALRLKGEILDTAHFLGLLRTP